MMADDGSTSVSLPELPLLAVLPGTGGLTRLVDKRMVRRDRADFFCTTEEGVRGKRAVQWRLVDEVVPRTQLLEAATRHANELASRSDRPASERGIILKPLARTMDDLHIRYAHLTIDLDRENSAATFLVRGPEHLAPANIDDVLAAGCEFWPLAMARELEDAILHLRANEETIRSWIFRTEGDIANVRSYDALLLAHADHWLIREIRLYLKRVLKRIDVSSRSLFATIEPGSCFHGTLLELALAADRIFMLNGKREGDELPAATIGFSAMNFGVLPMCNGLSRLQTRFLGEPQRVEELRARLGEAIDTEVAEQLGLVTFTPDDIDWEDEVRVAIEERAAFSSDALTGMEASLRFAGPETIESKIFARLSAWQNWIFQRPNAVGEKGALKLYGSGQRPEFDPRRV
jgi:benzoyl-CoA-dihydrodiol lyase